MAVLSPAQAAKKKAEPESYAIVAGTVFREPGFALPNAIVTLTPDPSTQTPPVKIKKIQAVTSPRGEFIFRVPPTTMRYTVKASAKGYHEEEKTVEIQGETRVDVTLSLREESK